MYHLLEARSGHSFGFIFVSLKTMHTVGVRWMCFEWRHRWWVIENIGTQDVNFFIGHTASVWILLTAKEMSPTVRDTATHCSSICAREARNLLLYVWEIHNQHSPKSALGLFTGLKQCIYIHFILAWVYRDHLSSSLRARSWGKIELQPVGFPPPVLSHLYSEGLFYPPEAGVIHFESCNRDFNTQRKRLLALRCWMRVFRVSVSTHRN